MCLTLSLNRIGVVVACIVFMLISGCGGGSAVTPSVTSEMLKTPTQSPTIEPIIPVVTPEATPDGPSILSLWLPEPVSPVTNEQATFMMADQIDMFHIAQSDIRVEPRLKKGSDVGGVMETLKSASTVAPGALPDITLLRRSDLLAAAQSGLIQPLEGTVTSAILGDLYPAALELGQVNNMLYGLPYGLEVEHIAYRSVVLSGNFATFEDVLLNRQTFVFPAAVVEGISDVLLLQYLSAGGTQVELQVGQINAEALRTVLDFYQAAVEGGAIQSTVLNYDRPEDYLAGLIDGSVNAAVVSSTHYLDLLARGQQLESAPIPLFEGDPMTIINGWMWVIVTKDKNRQLQAAHFLDWVFDASRLAAYTRAINMLPPLRAAMRLWQVDGYNSFAVQLLTNAHLPFAASPGNAPRAMQTALAAVISGQRTAEEAVADAIDVAGG
ncbi:MAG: extracellular solute-binding protein [Anaerolineae bacterium]|nr:extracellular solute-binding protein [Anaerolineae bacterium]